MVLNFVINGHHSFGDILFKINWKSEIKCSTNEVPNETFVELQLMKTKFPLELFPTKEKKEFNNINGKNSNAKNKDYKIKMYSSVLVIWNLTLQEESFGGAPILNKLYIYSNEMKLRRYRFCCI